MAISVRKKFLSCHITNTIQTLVKLGNIATLINEQYSVKYIALPLGRNNLSVVCPNVMDSLIQEVCEMLKTSTTNKFYLESTKQGQKQADQIGNRCT